MKKKIVIATIVIDDTEHPKLFAMDDDKIRYHFEKGGFAIGAIYDEIKPESDYLLPLTIQVISVEN